MSPGPSTGFEILVPGRQDLFARRILIPLAAAPISFGTSTRAFSFLARLWTMPISRRLRPGQRSVRTDVLTVHPAKMAISSARSGMEAVVPHAAPSGVNNSSCGRCFPQTSLPAGGFVVTMRSQGFGDYKHAGPRCSLRSLTCLQVQVLPPQWMVGPSSHSRPRLGETPTGASSAVNGLASRRRELPARTGQPL